LKADEASLQDAYTLFKEEAQAVHKDYEPKTVNTYLNIRNVAKKLDCFDSIGDYLWDAYQQLSYEAFIDKLCVFQLWTEYHQASMTERCFQAITKVCSRAHDYAIAYDHPNCLRTSNMLDRLMQKMDRYLFMMLSFYDALLSRSS